jgi:glycosyltransferase involved in cell wall biosynthesis
MACGWVLLNSRRYDVIITTTPPLFSTIPGFLAHVLRKKWIVDVRDLWLGAASKLGFVKERSFTLRAARILERLSYANCDRVTVLTNTIGRHVKTLVPSKEPSEIVLIPHGIPLTTFKPSSSQREFQVIYSGSLGRAQALDEVMRAWKELLGVHKVKLVILGKGETEEELKTLCKNLKLEGFVDFAGAVPRSSVPQYVSRSLIGLVPLRYALGFEYAAPTKVFEYMACGVPFVASCGGELEEIAKSSGAGIIVRDNAPDISRAIAYLLDHREILESMSHNGRKYVETCYANEAVYARLFNEIKEIC